MEDIIKIINEWLSPFEYETISNQGRKMLMRQRSLVSILKRTFDDVASSMVIHDNIFLCYERFHMNTHLKLLMYLNIGYTVSITFSENLSYNSGLSHWELIFWKTGDINDYYDANVESINGNNEVVKRIKTFINEHTK